MMLLPLVLLLARLLSVSGFTKNPLFSSKFSQAAIHKTRPPSYHDVGQGQGNSALPSLLKLSESNQDRSEGLRKAMSLVREVKDDDIRVGSPVVAGTNIPNLGIWQFQSCRVMSIYDQTTDEAGVVHKVPRESLSEEQFASGSTRYVTLYSPKHHPDGLPVVVSPEEVELSSMRDEVVDSVLMALPLFGFWTALAFSFASQYSERTGGTLADAVFGT